MKKSEWFWAEARLNVVLNWFEELEQLVRGGASLL